MTVPSTPSRNDYIGTGLLDAYDFSFRITSEADLLVTKQDTLGVSTTLTYPTDYTVTGVGDFPGGTITLTAGNLPTGYLLTIRDDPALVQTSDIRNQGDFFPEIHEDAFDYVTRIVKSQQDTLDRAVKLSETTTGVSAELPAPEAGYSIVWNATADGLINAVMASAPTSAFMATVLDDETAADARTTLGVPAAANGTHTGTTAVQTLAASVAATAPTRAQADNTTNVATTEFVQAARISKILPIDASVAANALTITLQPCVLDFRSSTLGSGAVSTRTVPAAITLTVPSSATLGTISAQQSRLVVLAIDNAGTVELAVCNISGGTRLDETGTLNTTTISAGSTSASTVYSTTGRTLVPYRVVGYIESTQATAGTWATAPSTIQGVGGQALVSLNTLGDGQTWQDLTGSRAVGTTYYNTTGRPIMVAITTNESSAGGNSRLTVAGVPIAASSQAYGVVMSGAITAVIPPGASYVLAHYQGGGATTLNNWSELR